jgi:hypothetical protein
VNEILNRLDGLLFPAVDGIVVSSVEADGAVLRVAARCTTSGARYPDCGD